MRAIPYGRQHIDKSDIRAVTDVLESDWITQGPKINEFEKALARYCGAKYAIAVSTGTAALHLACLAAGLKKGNEAITTPITFLATPNSVLYTGARPVFADIDYQTINISPEEIKKKISKRTKAVLPVHFSGLPCEMSKISRLAGDYGLTVIEDACHALGAEYKSGGKWHKVGSCRYSDTTVFSFHPVKHITTGEGGAITTNNKKIYEKLKALRSHGIYKTPDIMKKKGQWHYEMRDLGFNYRITDFQCALGLNQLTRIDSFVKSRGQIAKIYNKEFSELKGMVKLPELSPRSKKPAWHLYILRFLTKKSKSNKAKIFKSFVSKNIYPQVHYIPVVDQPFYRGMGFDGSRYPAAREYYKEAISLPIFPGLKKSEIMYITKNVKELVHKYGK